MKFEFALYIKKKKTIRKEKGRKKGKGVNRSRAMKCLVPCHTVFSFVAKEGRCCESHARQQNDKPLTPNTNNECLHSAH